jgi:hypothetical protein
MTRNDGTRFHEGVDLKPAFLNSRGEAVDAVRAALAGRVAYVCDRVNGAYGRYVVLEHPRAELPVYTLYAHLASVRGDLQVGREVPEGHVLGILGRSSAGIDPIPPERAHLHFEIGLRLSDNFDAWYARSPHRREPNPHGNHNGMNLAGFEPLESVLLRPRVDVHTVVNNLPAALVVVARTRQAHRAPELAGGPAPPARAAPDGRARDDGAGRDAASDDGDPPSGQLRPRSPGASAARRRSGRRRPSQRRQRTSPGRVSASGPSSATTQALRRSSLSSWPGDQAAWPT